MIDGQAHGDGRGSSAARDGLIVLIAAVLGRLPVLGAYWTGDDWTLLARAAGLIDGTPVPWRFVSRELWWDLLYPLFGLAVDPWTWARLLLHGAAAWLTWRLARRLGLGRPAALSAGLILAATPLAFASLYRASGVQELLGATLALLAIERLLAGGRAGLIAGLTAGLAAVFAQENALWLGPFVLALGLGGDPARRRGRVATGAFLSAAALLETAWLMRGLPGGSGLGLDVLRTLPETLALGGWWLVSPRPGSVLETGPLVALGGLSIWFLWIVWARLAWRRELRWPAAALGAALLSLLPALGSGAALRPCLVYLAVAPAALTLVAPLWGDRRRLAPVWVGALALVAVIAGWGLTEARLRARDADGRPTDPHVLATAVSHDALRTLDAVPAERSARVVILQIPGLSTPRGESLLLARDLPLPSVLHEALAGDLAYRLAGDPERRVDWVRRLDDVPLAAMVYADTGDRLVFWGPVAQGLIYQALTLIALDRPDDAVAALASALRNSRRTMPFVFDASQLPVPLERVQAHSRAFLARIRTADALRDEERGPVEDTARDLLARCGVTP